MPLFSRIIILSLLLCVPLPALAAKKKVSAKKQKTPITALLLPVSPPLPAIPVEIDLTYAKDNPLISWVTSVTLSLKDSKEEIKAEAIHKGPTRLYAYFPTVRAGKTYTIRTATMFDTKNVGLLDLSKARGLVKTNIMVFSAPIYTVSPAKQLRR